MGIQYFAQLIKDHCDRCYYEVPLENFRGKSIAIDISNLTFMMMCVATKEVTDSTNLATDRPDRDRINRLALDKIIARLALYIQHGITPVSVFDGVTQLKENTKAKRREDKEKVKAKLQEAEARLYSVDPIFRTQMLIDEYAKYYKQVNDVSFDFINELRNVLATVGFPVISAADFGIETQDAEGICAALCLQGNDYCVATASNDSDYHAYGGNLEMVDIYSRYVTTNGIKTMTYYAKVRSLEAILQQSGLTFESFRDLCILMGTDFNPNIKGVGAKRSWDYIVKHRSILNMAYSNIDISALNYPNVIKIFASTIVKVNIPPPDFNVERFREFGRTTFDLYQLRDHASSIADSLNQSFKPQVSISL